MRLVVGCRLDLEDGAEPAVLSHRPRRLWPAVPPAHARQAPRREGRMPARLRRSSWRIGDGADLGRAAAGSASTPAFADFLASPRRGFSRRRLSRRAASLSRRRLRRIHRLAALAERAGVPLVATNDVLYHVPERRRLQDVVTCIREGCTIAEAGFRLIANAERHLKPPEEMARLFRDHPDARRAHARDRRALPLQPRRAALRISRRDRATGCTPQAAARAPDLARARRERYPDGVPEKVRAPARARARAHRRARLRALFPHRPRHRARGARARHPVPGARLGGQFRGLLLPRHHRGRSRASSISCSSASSAPSATSRPTSTSISSTSGARR